MAINLKASIDRATKLMDTPVDYEDYSIIKIKPAHGGCCCFHCWPNTWVNINQYVFPSGPIKDEGDVLLNKDGTKYVLECHESGPEIIFYGVVTGLMVEAIKKLISVFLKALQNEKRKQINSLEIKIIRQIKGQIEVNEIMEVKLPVSDDIVNVLNDNLKNALKNREKQN